MADIVSLLVCCQALGAAAGFFMAVRGEIAYVDAMRDKKIDHAERAHLDHIAAGLRFGMSVLLISSFGLVIVEYAINETPQPALTASYWALITIALLVTSISWALSRNRISFALASAIVFTGWWFLVYFAFGLMPLLSFGAILAFFVVATGAFYGVLQATRYFSLRSKY
jgi:hypothetical protein